MTPVARPRTIRITAGAVSATAQLSASRSAQSLWDALPLEAKAQTWGDEIYFGIGITMAPESPRATVDMGDLGYWPPGQAFCIFFGATPASEGGEIRPASPVNVLGRVDGDATVFKKVHTGTPVRVERAS